MSNRMGKWLLPAGAAALASAMAWRARTRGYDKIHPELRSLLVRFRTPSVGKRSLSLMRRLPATSCVSGVTVDTYQVRSTDEVEIVVYVYRPDGVATGGPTLFYTHGGGMVSGSAKSYHASVSDYARDLGVIAVSTEYRLAPEHPFPTPLDDVHAAYRWLVAQSGIIGIDPQRIVVAGESAGGGLTAALCQRVRDEGGVAPIFQALIYPMLDDRTTLAPAPNGRGQLIWTETSNLFGWTSYLGRAPTCDRAPPYAAPARTEDLAGVPPAWIGVGDIDLFYDEDVAYAERLRTAGIASELYVAAGAYHAFDLMGQTTVGRNFRDSLLHAIRRSWTADAHHSPA